MVQTWHRAAAHFLLWLFRSLLMGAFSASLAATIGGPQRDHIKANSKGYSMRSILLYLLGVPIPFILLIALFTHHF